MHLLYFVRLMFLDAILKPIKSGKLMIVRLGGRLRLCVSLKIKMLSKSSLFVATSIFPDSITAAESTRHGGISPAPYSSLNLGLYTPDHNANVTENRKRFFASLGILPQQVAGAHQVHGDRVCPIEKPGQIEGYDALITQQKGLFLTVTIADCTPVLIYDPLNEVVAAVHAGWRGTANRIVQKAVEKMHSIFHTDPSDCLAYIGTCIDECDFEVDKDVAMHFAKAHQRWDESRQKYFVDLKAANQAQLLALGLAPNQIEVSTYSTVRDNEHFFSHRKEHGKTGRSLAVIGIKH